MNTHPSSSRTSSHRFGFTLVEVLVVITIIGILAGLLTVAVQRALITAQEFAVKNEMTQMEAAMEKFNIDYGFYPPSFKGIANVANTDGPNAAKTLVMSYLSRISPNHAESQIIDRNSGRRRIDIWWDQVGVELIDTANNPGADMVFWLSGLSKNKQFPLTYLNPATDQIEGLAAHGADEEENIERQAYFEFDTARMRMSSNGNVAAYSQSDRKFIPYLYLDARNYLPSGAMAQDGAYCRPGFSDMDYELIENGNLEFASPLFKQIYPNHDKFQLISFGLDGLPGVSDVPNRFNEVGIEGRDNFVNFGGEGPTKLDTVILELN